jgi:hypothetical protein
MAKRIEPFRDYSEHEVINLFSLKVDGLANFQLLVPGAAAGKDWDSGVVVAAEADAKLPGDLPSKLASASTDPFRSYLGMSPSTGVGVGFNAYPVNDMNVRAAASDARNPALGITLKETLAYDENGENLLRYAVKKDELQCVLPGQAVPILTRGMVLLADAAIANSADVACKVGAGLTVGLDGASDGQFVAGVAAAGDVGRIVAQNQAGDKWLCKLSF